LNAPQPRATATPRLRFRACARGFADQFTDLSLTIDGVAVADLQQFRVHSQVFRITAADGNVFGVPAGTTRSVADGYWALIRRLSPGTHTVSFGGALPVGYGNAFMQLVGTHGGGRRAGRVGGLGLAGGR
jgi:hypothetical protein